MEFIVQAYVLSVAITLQRYKGQKEASYSPHALHMVWPLSSRRHRGVMVVPQFWQATTTVAFCA